MPGCTLADAQSVVGHGALPGVGINLTVVSSRTIAGWTVGSATAGFEPRGVEIDANGASVAEIAVAPTTGRTVEIGRVSAAAGTDGVVRLVSDRRFRDDHGEYVECGTFRGQVARLTDEGQYEDEGAAIHFDMASCRSVVAAERPFVMGTYPASDEDLFSGIVYQHAQWWGAPSGQFARLWSYAQSQDVFDQGIPWLRALALDAPAEPVGVALPGGGLAVAWRHRGAVYLQWLGADLTPRGAPRVISTRSMQPGLPQLAVNGTDVVALFAQRAGVHARSAVYAVRLPLNGNALPHIVLAQGPEDAFAPSAVAIGTDGWAVTWSQSGGQARRGVATPGARVWLRMFDRTLRPVGDAQLVSEHASDSRIAGFASGQVVVTAMGGDAGERDVLTRSARCAGRDAAAPP